MPTNNAVAALARQQLNQVENPDELARKQAAAQAAAEAAAEAEAVVASRVRASRAEDDDALDARMRRNSKRVAAGWSALDEPPRPGPFDE